ncbi:MAG: radical SAM protein, partial [Clostridia bacterium]|nr:radical SAM protein [Clostridia bacterium]
MAKAVVFTLGCKVNDVEGASLVRGLKERGYEVATKLSYADLYILNTCAVTAEAEKKSRQLLARVYKYNPDAKIIVCGCAVQKNAAAFQERKGVYLVTGARQKSKILNLLDEQGTFIDDFDKEYDNLPLPAAVKSRHFVKIQDGCNNFCTYCIVPYLRGRSRSRALEDIVAEVAQSGAEETVLTGIDISSYNDKGRTLSELLKALSHIPTRLRLGSLEVGVIDEKLLKTAAEIPEFAPHFHLSLQSGSSSVLKRMNRH